MKRLPEVDVVIVGAGWTGLLIAKELVTRSALKVTILTEPSQLGRSDAEMRFVFNKDTAKVSTTF